MLYPGQRVQIDVKVVPKSCIIPSPDGILEQFYQYTAIDEYSRFRFVVAFKEHNSYSSTIFLDALIKAFPFKIECIQTDNGLEFIKSFNERKSGKLSLFEQRLKDLGISHKLINPLLLDIMVKLNALIEKITNIFMLLINFILLMILNLNLLSILDGTILSL